MLGASGAMAAIVIRDLIESDPEIRVTAADLRPPEFPHEPELRRQPPERLGRVACDVNDPDATARAMNGHDAVLNCVTYYFNRKVMLAALAARVPYADLGGLYHGTLAQFELHDSFVSAGVPAVLGMGSTPGITNVMAGALAARVDRLESLAVRVGCVDTAAASATPLPVPYSLDTILDEFSLAPHVFEDGVDRAVAPMSGEEVIDFPSPVGRAEAIYTLHSEVAMFPRSFPGLRHASFKVAFAPEFTAKIRFLVQLGFASRDAVGGTGPASEAIPRQVLLALAGFQYPPPGAPTDCDVLRVDAIGSKDGRRVRARAQSVIFPHPDWNAPAGSLDTGVPLSVVGQMLARRDIREPGVHGPERVVPHEPFFEAIARRGIIVNLDGPHAA